MIEVRLDFSSFFLFFISLFALCSLFQIESNQTKPNISYGKDHNFYGYIFSFFFFFLSFSFHYFYSFISSNVSIVWLLTLTKAITIIWIDLGWWLLKQIFQFWFKTKLAIWKNKMKRNLFIYFFFFFTNLFYPIELQWTNPNLWLFRFAFFSQMNLYSCKIERNQFTKYSMTIFDCLMIRCVFWMLSGRKFFLFFFWDQK